MRWMMSALLVLTCVAFTGCSTPRGDSPDDKRAYVMEMHDDVLAELYRARPHTKVEVENAPGYAVFSNTGLKLFFVGAGQGYGIVIDQDDDETTYMRMGEVGVGLGLGLKDFRAVFVFLDHDTLDTFVQAGWEFGADADAAAKAGDKGGQASGAASVGGMRIYQFTENGLALQAMVNGTRYWKDKELN